MPQITNAYLCMAEERNFHLSYCGSWPTNHIKPKNFRPLGIVAMEAKVYTLKETAALTRLSLDAVRDAAAAGRIPAIKLGKWLVLKEPLDRMLRGETLTQVAQ